MLRSFKIFEMTLASLISRTLLRLVLPALLFGCATEQTGITEIYSGRGMFGEIYIYDDADGFRTMEFERGAARHALVRRGDPLHLEFEYSRIALIGLALSRKPPQRILVVGLGGGSLPVFLHRVYPEVQIDVVEIDPEVVRVAKKYFDVTEDARLRIHVADGRRFIEQSVAASYDIVILDAFGASELPTHLSTLEFLRSVRAVLRPDGVSVSNIWGPNSNPRYFDMVATHQAVFDGLAAIYAPSNVNVVLFGLPRPERLEQAALARRAREVTTPPVFRYDLGGFIEQAWIAPAAAAAQGKVLRDRSR
jgi:spermidine synthase